jgi:hypothetical protein
MFYQFDKVSHQDMSVTLRDPVGRPSTSELGGLPGVQEVEPQLAVVCDLSNGPYKKRTDVTGLAPGNRLYTPLDRAGKPMVIPDEGLVLTRKLAEILNVRMGDTLRLRPLIGRRQEVKAVVVGMVDSFLGLSAYADIKYLSRLLGEDWSANFLLSDVTGDAPKKPLLDGLKERPRVIGIGESDTANRCVEAVEEALNSPLLDVDITGASGALLNVTGGENMTVSEAERVAEIIQSRISPNARIIWGAAIDPTLHDKVKVMVVITGVKSKHILGPKETSFNKSMEVDFIR